MADAPIPRLGAGTDGGASDSSGQFGLRPYTADVQLKTLAIGLDNIHYDVFLSPRFVEFTQKYVLDLVRQAANLREFSAGDARSTRPAETGAFKKLLAELLTASLTKAKFEHNIEVDLLLRLAVLKFLTTEISTQFSNLLLECKEWIRSRGEYFERSERAHVLRARLSDLQTERRNIYRQIGQHLYQILAEAEDTQARSRRALFGDDFALTYDLLRNRLVFVEGGRDDQLYLEHYVLLGNFLRDEDRFEVVDGLFLEFLRDSVRVGAEGEEVRQARQAHADLTEKALKTREALARLEEESARLARRLEGGHVLSRLWQRKDDSDTRAALADAEKQAEHLRCKLDEMGEALEAARQKADYLAEQYNSQLGDYLNDPENARRLFGSLPAGPDAVPRTAAQEQWLDKWVERLERSGLLPYVLASYAIRNLYLDFCPPVHLQQLKRALVTRDELRRVEEMLGQIPARSFNVRRIDDQARGLRRRSREEVRAVAARFAEDFLRLRRDLRNHQRLSALMEGVNLVRAERTRELSRVNNSLYEYLLSDEARPAEDRVLSHAVIKADVRGSTKMTKDLLERGLNPASHMSQYLYQPVKRILERFGAAKVFIEGDAIILAIYETESNRAHQRAVAKACLLAREMLAVLQEYNGRAEANNLPRMELGIGIAFQNSAPTIWMDGESRIMISRALNLSDRLSSCSKAARRILQVNSSPFRIFLCQTVMDGASEEEEEEFLIRYNLNGIEVNDEGFAKLAEEISLAPVEMDFPMPWGTERATLYRGEVPMGESLEPIVIRKGVVRQLMPGGKLGPPGTRVYYEVCADPQIYALVRKA